MAEKTPASSKHTSEKKPKPSLWLLGGLTPLKLGKNVWKELDHDEVGVRAASLAYYFVLAVFPAMLFILSIVGFFAASGTKMQQLLYSDLARVLPNSASELFHKTMDEIVKASGAGKAIVGIVGALWSASGGVSAVMQCLNIAYEVKERRPWWKQKLIAVGLTLALAVLVLSALGIVLFGGMAADHFANHGTFGHATILAWRIVQWPLVLAFMFAAFAVTYYYAPDLEEPEWHWITPGSALGLVFWLLASVLFKVYLHFFNSYSKSYGSLGAAIILLLWLYITGYAILFGGEVNSEIGRAADAAAGVQTQPQDTDEHPKKAA
jgi:membrane protein